MLVIYFKFAFESKINGYSREICHNGIEK